MTGARPGVAGYGSLALSLTDRASELVSLLVDRHVAVLRVDDIDPDMDAAIDVLHEEFVHTGGSAILATGPSATVDMGELVKDAYGPYDAHVVLKERGYDVVTSDVECCGMAGSFGYESDYYELSMDVGDRLRDHLRADDVRERPVVASETSCLEQIDALFERRPRHPIELLEG